MAFAWRGAVRTNPFATLPVRKGIAKRERVLSDAEIAEIWGATGRAQEKWRGAHRASQCIARRIAANIAKLPELLRPKDDRA